MAQQTALEWLSDNLIGNPYYESDFAHNVRVFKQAKDMEKEQIIEAYKFGLQDEYVIGSEQYYNETYNK